MPRSRAHSPSRKPALAASIGLHFIAVAFLPISAAYYAGSGASQGGFGPAETVHVAYLRFERRSAHSATRAPSSSLATAAAAATPQLPKATASSHVAPQTAMRAGRTRTPRADYPSIATSNARANAPARLSRHLATSTAVRSSRFTLALTAATAEPEPSAKNFPRESAAPPATAATSAAAITSPSPPAAPSAGAGGAAVVAAAPGINVPPGGWGQSFEKPLVADESALATLRARYHASAAIVDVDETGRATHVSLPSNLADDVRAELEKRLLELRYVPAECNGLRCTGKLAIAL